MFYKVKESCLVERGAMHLESAQEKGRLAPPGFRQLEGILSHLALGQCIYRCRSLMTVLVG